MPDLDRLEQLKSCDEPAFRELYEIYAASIVARERKPQEWICKMVRSPEYRVWVMKSAGRVTGFSIVFLPSAGHFALLEYMAVAAERRNSGVGSELFQQSMRAVLSEGRSLPVLLEIDSDREAGDDQQIRTRRQRFYRRLGCVQVSGLQYILPLPGLGAPPEMDLMVYSTPPPLQQVPKSELERWLSTIYRDVYHASPHDPRIARMLHELPDPVRLA